MKLDISKVQTVDDDTYLGIHYPCVMLLVNSHDGATQVNEWKDELKTKYPSLPVYATTELKYLPSFWKKMVIDMLGPEPIVYFYDYEGSINEQLFYTTDPFTQERANLPPLTILLLKENSILIAKPMEIKKYSSKSELFAYIDRFLLRP